jgi:hypothetical protein
MEEQEFRDFSTETRIGRANLRRLFYNTHIGAEGINEQMIGNINPISRWLERYVEDDNYIITKEEAYAYLKDYLRINNLIYTIIPTEEVIPVKVQLDHYERIRVSNIKVENLEI